MFISKDGSSDGRCRPHGDRMVIAKLEEENHFFLLQVKNEEKKKNISETLNYLISELRKTMEEVNNEQISARAKRTSKKHTSTNKRNKKRNKERRTKTK